MADLDVAFDPTLKKKKKKKTKVLAAFGDDVATPAPATTEPVKQGLSVASDAPVDAPAVSEIKQEVIDDTLVQWLLNNDLDFTKPVADHLGRLTTKKRAAKRMAEDDTSSFSLDFSKKKKKKKSSKEKSLASLDDESTTDSATNAAATDADTTDEANEPQNYEYSELLKRVFGIIHQQNPELVSGEKRQFKMKPPQVVRLGAKKTGFVNFTEICKLLHRQSEHLLAYLLAELGTSGSVDSSYCLVVKGRFQQKQIQVVLKRYIREYVTCHTCRSPNTILAKYSRLYFLQCETCGSRCSVASIHSGFQAVTGKRAALRAKTQ